MYRGDLMKEGGVVASSGPRFQLHYSIKVNSSEGNCDCVCFDNQVKEEEGDWQLEAVADRATKAQNIFEQQSRYLHNKCPKCTFTINVSNAPNAVT